MRTFVGRERELAALRACFDQASEGRGNLVLCVGEPGIGKTYLADEFTRIARGEGALTAWGRPADSAGAPPFWPWREIVGALDGGDLPETDANPSFEERIRQFDAVCQMVSAKAAAAPVVLVLDDLHAADTPSQLLARHLLRTANGAPVLMIATSREDAPASLAREPNVSQLDLGGLDRQAVGAIVGPGVSPADVTALHTATGGNPFFVTELARQRSAGRSSRVPASIRDAIGHRIAQLGPACAAMLRAGAVVGTEFDLALVAAMSDSTAREVLDLVDRATGLILPGRVAGRQRFTHDLVREAVLAGLGAATRADLHRRAAIAIEARHPDRSGRVVFDLAAHWSEASVMGDARRATEGILRAANDAMRQHAYEDGRRWFDAALAIGASLLAEVERGQLLVGLAGAQALTSDFTAALDTCQQAIDIAVRTGRPDIAAQAALVPHPTFDPQVDQLIRSLSEQALPMLTDTMAARVAVLGQHAMVCDSLLDLAAAEESADEALRLAGTSADPDVIEAALVAHHFVRSGPDDLEERDANAARMARLGEETGDPRRCLLAAEWRFDAAAERGDLAAVARELASITRWATRLGGPLSRWRRLRCQATLAQARGRLADASSLAAEALATMAPTGYPMAFVLWSGFLSMQARQVGYSPEIAAQLGVTDEDATQQDLPAGIIMTLGTAFVLLELGRKREAEVLYRRLGPAADWEESPHGALFTWLIGIMTAVGLGIDEDVAALRVKLDKWRGHHIVNGRYAMAYAGPTELFLGVAAAHLGLFDEAVADISEAVGTCAAVGADGYRAEAEYELASALARRSAPGDALRARDILAGLTPQLAELGMVPIHAKAAALFGRLAAADPGGLTGREREVAKLVARGLTNREIATRLVLSPRTAQNHVQHILDKLGLPNRGQIAVWVLNQANP